MDLVNKIKVLHITPLLTVGGAEKKLLYILRKLDRAVFSQHVIYSIPGALKEEVKREGVPLKKVYPMSLLNPISLISIWRLYKYIRKHKIDIVHCHLDVAYIMGTAAAAMARVPVIFSFQNIADEKVLSYYRIFRRIEMTLSPLADMFLVESDDVMKVLLSWGLRREKIEIIPNGVEIPANEEPSAESGEVIKRKLGIEGSVVIGNMARLVDFKNHRLLLDSACKVIGLEPNVKVLIIGDGPLREELERRTEQLGITRNVLFLGTVLDFEPYLQALDLFVLTSLTESTPLALLHALACGLPVVSTAVGDIPSIIRDGVDGILVPSDDVTALTKAMIQLINDQEQRKRIGHAGRQTAEQRFSVEAMMSKIAGVYLSISERQKR